MLRKVLWSGLYAGIAAATAWRWRPGSRSRRSSTGGAMPTQEADGNASLGTATKQVAEHASSLARLELELATLELKRKMASLGVGIGLGVGSAVFGLFM